MTLNAESKLAARYGTPDVLPIRPSNETIDQLLDHRSVRAFTDQSLPEGTNAYKVITKAGSKPVCSPG